MEPTVGPSFSDRIAAVIENSLLTAIDLIPTVIGMVLIAYAGLFLGRKLQPTITNAGRQIGLDEKVRETPFAAVFPDGEDGVSRTFAGLFKAYLVVVAFLVAVEWFMYSAAGTSLVYVTNIGQDLLSYVPGLVLGLFVLFIGFFVANWAAEQVRESDVANQFTPALSGATKAILYFVVIVIGLDTIDGINAGVLHTFAEAFAYAAGLAAAIAIGVAFGWGGKDYVAENIDDWFEDTSDVAKDAAAPGDD
ncbi:mechanosensitive ion channel family protein [Halopiger goleimassiliensis]|uniref:mechanosensitive ion channel family protein n=1 Tax=Halopiger goleimassiliensis TaxID=1293048 RepID=UPI0006777740|nr:hypothetical protein [Halopiger goleimassiliensis]